jgi:calcineurin-like phosphoesterase family protein
MIYFTADCHFNHKKIIELMHRPFSSIGEMNTTIINAWNKKVKKDDEIYVLGDFCWSDGWHKDKSLLDSLNGRKTLILGNHDRFTNHARTNSWFEIANYKEIFIDNYRVVLFHYPILEWNEAYKNSVHLHGHTHGTVNLREYQTRHGNKQCYDVGMDFNDFVPLSWEELKVKLMLN